MRRERLISSVISRAYLGERGGKRKIRRESKKRDGGISELSTFDLPAVFPPFLRDLSFAPIFLRRGR